MKKTLLLFLATTMLMAVSSHAMEDTLPIHRAVANNNQAEILALLEKGFFINQVDVSGRTPLHNASVTGNLELVLFLIDHGADARLLDNDGHTPLWQALSMENNDEVVLTLIRHGAYQEYKDKDKKRSLVKVLKGNSWLKLLVSGNNKAMMKYLRLTKKQGLIGNLKEALRILTHYDNQEMIQYIFENFGREYIKEDLLNELFLRACQIGNMNLLRKIYLTISVDSLTIKAAFIKAIEARKVAAIKFLGGLRRLSLATMQEIVRNIAIDEETQRIILQEIENIAQEDNLDQQEIAPSTNTQLPNPPRQLIDLSARHTFLL